MYVYVWFISGIWREGESEGGREREREGEGGVAAAETARGQLGFRRSRFLELVIPVHEHERTFEVDALAL